MYMLRYFGGVGPYINRNSGAPPRSQFTSYTRAASVKHNHKALFDSGLFFYTSCCSRIFICCVFQFWFHRTLAVTHLALIIHTRHNWTKTLIEETGLSSCNPESISSSHNKSTERGQHEECVGVDAAEKVKHKRIQTHKTF